MGEQRNLMVGFDLCETYTQLSVLHKNAVEPETIHVTIPTALGISKDKKEWVYGEEAYVLLQHEEGIVIDRLLAKLCCGEEVDVFSVKFSPVVLMEKYLRKCLQLIKKNFPNDSIFMLCITLKETSTILCEGIYSALEALGIGKDRAMIQNHTRSYGYYALSQSKELWMSDVGLFELDEEGLTYHQISIDRKTTPLLAVTSSKNLKEDLKLEQIEEAKTEEEISRLKYFFVNLSKNILHRQYVTTLYITGKGFEGHWSEGALKELCSGRRVFKGQNLYSKGACYAAKAGEQKEYIIVDDEMITTNIYLQGVKDGKLTEIFLVKGISPWYEAKNNIDLILDECSSITLYFKDLLKNQLREETISLTDMPVRPAKTTKVGLEINFVNKETVRVLVKDKGFGDFYPASEQTWMREITID
ncbi:MAG: DUF5716 family protein [Anaerocolumna sp.]